MCVQRTHLLTVQSINVILTSVERELEVPQNEAGRAFSAHPMESHILFQALLDPPEHLSDMISSILAPLQDENLRVCRKMLSHLPLREGITEEQGERYFLLMQQMFNEYFSSAAVRDKSVDERIALHEKSIPEFLDIMIYGLADNRKQ